MYGTLGEVGTWRRNTITHRGWGEMLWPHSGWLPFSVGFSYRSCSPVPSSPSAPSIHVLQSVSTYTPVPLPKTSFLASPNEYVSKCSLWTGICWEKPTVEPHPKPTVSQTLEAGPGICDHLSPKGKKNHSFNSIKGHSNGVRSHLTMWNRCFCL